MTAQPPDKVPRVRTPRRWSRRKLFAQVGAGGLAVAAATFGRSTPAYAATCGCCNLAHCPPNDSSYQNCISHASYSWRCYYTRSGIPYQCQCCERKGITYSHYACWPR